MSDLSAPYFPPPESEGGWRSLLTQQDIRASAGMDPNRLSVCQQLQSLLYAGFSWSIVIIRHGYLVGEWASFNVLSPTRFDLWSGTKTFAATAWGLLLSDRIGRLAEGGSPVSLDTPIYEHIPEGHPLTDPRKSRITVGQVLSMTGGFRGENTGAVGAPTGLDAGSYEHALGRAPNRSGVWVDTLVSEPGSAWDYSDPGYCHLALAFANITGREIADVMENQVFSPIGIEHASWDVQGGGGFLGPHTNPHTGLHMSARELARFGYLALHGGKWDGAEILPGTWQAIATRPSQEFNPAYGYGWWTNAHDTYAPGLPTDLFALAGFAGNRCYIVPSCDLVVARVGTGPFVLDERSLVAPLVAAIID